MCVGGGIPGNRSLKVSVCPACTLGCTSAVAGPAGHQRRTHVRERGGGWPSTAAVGFCLKGISYNYNKLYLKVVIIVIT